jgi:hypothetical protein
MQIRVINETGLVKDTRVVDKFGRDIGAVKAVHVHMVAGEGLVRATIELTKPVLRAKDVEWSLPIEIVRQLAADHGCELVKSPEALPT